MIDSLSTEVEMVAVGDIVIYIDEKGFSRPAIVTSVWSDECVNLNVFRDGTQDGSSVVPVYLKTSVMLVPKIRLKGYPVRDVWYSPKDGIPFE